MNLEEIAEDYNNLNSQNAELIKALRDIIDWSEGEPFADTPVIYKAKEVIYNINGEWTWSD